MSLNGASPARRDSATPEGEVSLPQLTVLLLMLPMLLLLLQAPADTRAQSSRAGLTQSAYTAPIPPGRVELVEERPFGWLVPGVAEYLTEARQLLRDSDEGSSVRRPSDAAGVVAEAGPEATFHLIGSDEVSRALALNPHTGELRVRGPIDRDSLCPRLEADDDDGDGDDDGDDRAAPEAAGQTGRGRGAEARPGELDSSPVGGLLYPPDEAGECSRLVHILMRWPAPREAGPTTRLALRVVVHDVNDNPPAWPGLEAQRVSFVETNGPAATSVASDDAMLAGLLRGQAKSLDRAVDPDAGSNGTLVYQLVGRGADWFHLDDPQPRASGQSDTAGFLSAPVGYHLDGMEESMARLTDSTGRRISTGRGLEPLRIWPTRPLDREAAELPLDAQGRLNLTLVAMDTGLPRQTGSIPVIITLVDLNDHAPQFQASRGAVLSSLGSESGGQAAMLTYRPPRGMPIREGLRLGTSVVRLNATDADAGLHAKVVYEFCPCEKTRASEYFAIDPNNGEITVAKALDYDRGPRRFHFKASRILLCK